jgi:hypothetical protein
MQRYWFSVATHWCMLVCKLGHAKIHLLCSSSHINLPWRAKPKVKLTDSDIQVMEVTDFYDSLLGAASRADCILTSLSSGMWCRLICSISNRVSEEPATPIRAEKVFLQTSVNVYWTTCIYMPEKIDLHTFVNDRGPQPHTTCRSSIIGTYYAHIGKNHILWNLSNDAGKEICVLYTGISHTGWSTKELDACLVSTRWMTTQGKEIQFYTTLGTLLRAVCHIPSIPVMSSRTHISKSYMHSAMGGGAAPENQSRSVQ